jgi:hypothetical protein
MVEELQAAQAVNVQKVWDFLGQTKMALLPLSFNPVHSGEPAREVSNVLPVLDSVGAKMLTLEEVISEQLEAEGHVLVEHVLTCFRSRDPKPYLELVMQGPIIEAEEMARASIQDTAKIVAAWFER